MGEGSGKEWFKGTLGSLDLQEHVYPSFGDGHFGVGAGGVTKVLVATQQETLPFLDGFTPQAGKHEENFDHLSEIEDEIERDHLDDEDPEPEMVENILEFSESEIADEHPGTRCGPKNFVLPEIGHGG